MFNLPETNIATDWNYVNRRPNPKKESNLPNGPNIVFFGCVLCWGTPTLGDGIFPNVILSVAHMSHEKKSSL